MSVAIKAQNVSKTYSPNTRALENLDLEVVEGSSFAFLGPNGAGKTTFVKSILGLVSIDKGHIELDYKDIKYESSRGNVAYLPEKFSFYPYYTAYGVLLFYAQMRGVSKERIETDCINALKKVGIEELKDKKLQGLSKGQLQRVGIATLLVGNNKILILDEPFSGIDPVGVKELRDVLISLKSEGKTLFINSHILAEIEKICDDMAIIDKGRCLVSGNLKKLIQGSSLEDYFYKTIKQSH